MSSQSIAKYQLLLEVIHADHHERLAREAELPRYASYVGLAATVAIRSVEAKMDAALELYNSDRRISASALMPAQAVIEAEWLLVQYMLHHASPDESPHIGSHNIVWLSRPLSETTHIDVSSAGYLIANKLLQPLLHVAQRLSPTLSLARYLLGHAAASPLGFQDMPDVKHEGAGERLNALESVAEVEIENLPDECAGELPTWVTRSEITVYHIGGLYLFLDRATGIVTHWSRLEDGGKLCPNYELRTR